MVHTGRGFGHQRAAITLMEKLRELGFKGTFDVQCDDRLGASLFNPKTKKMYINNEPLVSRKLMNMIPGFASRESHSVGARATHTLGSLGAITISALPHDYATNSTFCLPAADLAVCAADDNSWGKEATQAKVLGASAYIGLEPTDWHMGSCFVTDVDGIVTSLPGASNLRLSSVASDQLPSLSSISLSDTEKRIINIIENSQVNSQLVYGLYPDRNYSIESDSMTESRHLEEAVEMQRLIEAHLTLNPHINKPTL